MQRLNHEIAILEIRTQQLRIIALDPGRTNESGYLGDGNENPDAKVVQAHHQ